MNLTHKKTILILSANPKDTTRLRFDEEIRKIDEALRDSKYPGQFEIKTSLATPVADLQRVLLRYKPQIVHFCGHGELNGLLFEDETGKKQQIPVEALADLFKLCGNSIECVVLNACQTKPQAEAIHKYIPCVIGINQNIGDKAAILFTAGFYTGLGDGKSYRESFNWGRNRIGLDKISGELKPEILEKKIPAQQHVEQTNNLSKEIRILSNLPNRDPNFVGRKDFLSQFLPKIIRKKTVGIFGMPGIGKTALAIEICHIFKATWDGAMLVDDFEYNLFLLSTIIGNKKYFKDGIIWIRFDKNQNYEKLIEDQLIIQLGFMGKDHDIENILRYHLKDKDILIVFDSVEQNEDNFFKLFKMFNKFSRLITSRKFFDLPGYIKLFEMNSEEATSLFTVYLDRSINSNEQFQISKLCEKLGNLPLAIKIMAIRANNFDKSISELDYEYEKSKIKITQKMQIDGNFQIISLYAVFSISFDNLTESQKLLFVKAGTFNYPFTIDSLCGISDTQDISNDLDILIEISLINVNIDDDRNKTLYLHPLLKDYAIINLESYGSDNCVYDIRKKYFLEVVKNQKERLPLEINEILSVMRWCLNNDLKNDFLSFMEEIDLWLLNQGLWQQKIESNISAIEISKEMNDREREINFLDSLSNTLLRQGKVDESNKNYNICLKYYVELNKTDKILRTLYRMSIIKYSDKKYEECFIENFSYSRNSLYYKNIFYYGAFIRTNGWIARVLNQFKLAERLFVETVKARVDARQESNILRPIVDLADTIHNLGNHSIALDFYKKLYHLPRIHYLKEIKLSVIGRIISCYLKMSEIEYARNLIDLYNQLAIELQDIDSIEQTNLFKGQILLSENKFEESLNYFSASNDKGYKNYWIGRLYLSQNKVGLSMEYFEKALNYYITIGDILEIASISIWIAQVHLLNNKAKMAVELICKSENTLKNLQVIDLKNIEVVKNNIIQRVGENYFNDIASFYKKTEFTTEKTSYILPNIPSSIKSKDNKEMILIPSGVFFFGEGKRCITSGIEILKNIDSVLDNQYFKNHAKTKYLYPFYIDKYPVTIKEFLAFCNQSNTQVPEHLEKTKNIEENLPVTNLSIKEMKEYAKWYEKEIPLPEEWEKACRTEEGYFYPWGDYWESERLPNRDEYISYNSFMIHEVGKNAKNINKYGVCDLIGNISEITCCYENVIIKGGNIFCKSEEKLKAYHSEKINDNDKGFNIGFRCIKPVFKPNILNVFI